MPKKTLRILLAVFLLLTGIAVYPFVAAYFHIGKKDYSIDLGIQNLPVDQITSIKIQSKDNEAVLTKIDTGWNIASYKASEDQLQGLLADLKNLKIGQIVSRNAQNQPQYEITEDTGILFTFSSGNNEYQFVIGKQSAETDSFFIRKKDNNDVYIAYSPLRNKLSSDSSFWRDKTLVNLDKTKINKIEVAGIDQFRVYKNSDAKWVVEKGSKFIQLSDTESDQLFTSFSPLEGYGFASDTQKKEFDQISSKTYIKFVNDQNETIDELTLVQKDSDWWGITKNASDVYKIFSFKLSPLLKSPEKIK